MRSDVTFHSSGTLVRAWLYRPEGAAGDVPCVVMAHGFTAVRDQALPRYAERFAAAGCAVLLFDYRHFGASDGQPRQLLDVGRQHADYRRAIAYARALDGVDPERIVLFGSSFSGGHVVAVAAQDRRVAAVLAQVPFADGFATLLELPRWNVARLTVRALRDGVRALRGAPPVYVLAVGEPGELATLTPPEAVPGFLAITDEDSLWRNEYAARLLLTIALYRPITLAAGLTMPVLVSVADRDETVPPAPAARMGELAPRGEVVHYPIGHFEIYRGEAFERAIADQVDFLERHVLSA